MWIASLLNGVLLLGCVISAEEVPTTGTYSRDYSTDTKINTVTGDKYSTRYSYSERSATPSSRRTFYKRRPYSNPMPECAAQQVCNAVFMRLKFVQPLCRCGGAFNSPCSTRMNPNDGHTINLLSDRDGTKSQTLVKVCEEVTTVRTCNEPHDWMLLALQNVRSGKAHYLVVCKCPTNAVMEGPVLHTNPPYARIPGISVYGMLCVQGRKSRLHKEVYPPLPWDKVLELYNSTMKTRIGRMKLI